MVRRRRLAMMALAGVAGLGLQACVAVPVESRPVHRARPAYGYGGSGYSNIDVQDARRECVLAARDGRGYRGVRAYSVDVTGPDTAYVELRGQTPYRGYRSIGCTYDARTGRAWVR